MDIQMPGMDGLDAATLLRNLNINVPIIAFPANAYKEDIQKSIEAGMNDHLCKPFEQDDLISLLKNGLDWFHLLTMLGTVALRNTGKQQFTFTRIG
jgi:CheY-like chemotaxis protein